MGKRYILINDTGHTGHIVFKALPKIERAIKLLQISRLQFLYKLIKIYLYLLVNLIFYISLLLHKYIIICV